MLPGEHVREFYRKQGAESERERIIRLLEDTILIHTDQKFFLIRSIKSDNKE